MKKFLALFLLICMLISCLVACDSNPDANSNDSEKDTNDTIDTSSDSDSESDPDSESESDSDTSTPVATGEELYVGYGRVCITPDFPTKLAGFAETRVHKTVTSDIYASCTAVKDKNGEMVLLYALDLHGIEKKQADPLRKEIAKAVGIDYKNVVLNCSHNHAAPYATEISDLLNTKLVEAAQLAVEDFALCTALYAGSPEIQKLNFTRRYLTADGSFWTTGQERAAHETEGDHTMPMILFEREDKKDVLLVNWAAHVDSVKTNSPYTISSDFYGVARGFVEGKDDVYLSIFNGASGNMIPQSYMGEAPWNGTTVYGKDLGNVILKEMKKLNQLEIKSEIKVTSNNKFRITVDKTQEHLFEITSEIHSLYNQGGESKTRAEELMKEHGFSGIYEVMSINNRHYKSEYERIELSAISIGNIGFAVAPYEMFAETGINIKAASEFDITFVSAYSNGSSGYIPTEYSFPNGGYEVYNCAYVCGTAELIEAELIKMLAEIH